MNAAGEEKAKPQKEAEHEPETFRGWFELGEAQLRRSQYKQASESFSRAIELKADEPQAFNLLGVALAGQGHHKKALDYFDASLNLSPKHAATLHNRGVALTDLKLTEKAIESFRQAIAADPQYVEAWHHLGLALRDIGKKQESLAALQSAVALAPTAWHISHDLGLLLNENNRSGEAAGLMRAVVRARPKSADAHNTLGLAQLAMGRFSEAEASFERAVQLNPDFVLAHINLGTALKEQGRGAEAVACYEQAIRLDPMSASGHWNLGLTLLQMREFARGWAEYEWRFRRPATPRRKFDQPVWDGSPLAGKTILIYAEQGLGDTIQFIRYAPLIQARGGRVIFECPSPLAGLLARCAGIDQLITEGPAEPPFDVQLPLLSCPFALNEPIPGKVPYVTADVERQQRWGQTINSKAAGKLKVGLAWQGNPHHQLDRFRSIRLDVFEELAMISGIQLFSLQRGPGADQLNRWAEPFGIIELTSREVTNTEDWEDTAAIVANLDLCIAVDTAIAHLAGAMGVPTALMLSAAPDWRWHHHRRDTDWYPSAALYRQRVLGEWDEVIHKLALRCTAMARRFS